jgi:starch synthase (maltosyl-transferring)
VTASAAADAPQPARIDRERFPPVLIERVQPQLDGGRYPVKRLEGDTLAVSADILKDGHDLLAARVCVRGPGDAAWAFVPMRYEFNADRWSGAVPLDRIGRWTYTVEAWADHFATWRADLEKRVQSGMQVDTELVAGAAIVAAAAERAHAPARAALTLAATLLGAASALATERVRAALDPELRRLMDAHQDCAGATRFAPALEVVVDRERAGFAAWYELFPRSQAPSAGGHGTLADTARRLPALADLGFDVIYLPPIHPIGRTHRKGPNNTPAAGPNDPGSPWAIGNEHGGHTAIEPALGTLDDFDALVRAAESLGMEIALDYALQCSPDHPWVREHSEWFFVRPDGSIRYAENPPKKYQDIYPLDFWCADYERLWAACRDVLRFWIDHGVRTFRVDNPHTKPLSFWEWVIGEIHDTHPDVVFLAEAFTRPKRMQALAKLGFSQSYTYFTWRNAAAELREYVTELTQTEMAEYFRGNFFANTPDILHAYLQHGGRPAFRVRLVLAATLAPLYGIYSGFELCEGTAVGRESEEYRDSEKYQVRVRDWDAAGNLNADVRTLNRIRRENPALRRGANVTFHVSENDQILFYRRSMPGGANDLLIAVNLDPRAPQATMVHVPLDALGLGPDQTFVVRDLLTDAIYSWRGARNYVRLDPAEQVAHVLRVERA